MLLGFAQILALEALGDDATDQQRKDTARRWLGYWLDQLAAVHARLTARAIYNRASACKNALNAPSAGTPWWILIVLARCARCRSRRPLLPLPRALLPPLRLPRKGST